jgi:hypothetical protein
MKELLVGEMEMSPSPSAGRRTPFPFDRLLLFHQARKKGGTFAKSGNFRVTPQLLVLECFSPDSFT